jgi:hypothetical protein
MSWLRQIRDDGGNMVETERTTKHWYLKMSDRNARVHSYTLLKVDYVCLNRFPIRLIYPVSVVSYICFLLYLSFPFFPFQKPLISFAGAALEQRRVVVDRIRGSVLEGSSFLSNFAGERKGSSPWAGARAFKSADRRKHKPDFQRISIEHFKIFSCSISHFCS